MISSKRFSAHAFLTLTLLASLFLAACVAPGLSHAQEGGTNKMTPKYLIGDAVSLSNREYPEIDKAIQRFENSDIPGAQDFLERAKEKYPKLAPVNVMLAKMHRFYRSARGLQFYLERATIETPDDPEAYLILADTAFRAQRTAESLALFEYAAPLAEKFTENAKRQRTFRIRVLAGRAAVAERRRQWDQASEYLEQWLALDPENALAHTRTGIVQFRLDKAKEALASLTKARELNPDAPHPFVSLGQLFYANDENDKARKSFEKAYNEDKSDAKVGQAYAEWLIQMQELDKAQQVAAELRNQTPDAIPALLMDGIVAYMQGDSARAESALQKVLSLDPRNAQATDLMALLLIDSDEVSDKERALQYAQNNSERLPNNAQASVTRAYVLYELGRKEEANTSLQSAGKLQIQPDSTYLIAKILAAEGQDDKAIAALEKIVGKKGGLIIFHKDAEELLAQLNAKTGTN